MHSNVPATCDDVYVGETARNLFTRGRELTMKRREITQSFIDTL